jgi:putative ABC transport system permease protein
MTDTALQPDAPAVVEQTGWSALVISTRLATRELRGGVGGFGILIACIALGVAVIAGVGSLATALLDGFNSQGRVLIGGDLTLRRVHRRATTPERRAMDAFGRVAETAAMRAMARTSDGQDQTLVELKGVGGRYPLVGSVRLRSKRRLDEAIGARMAVAVGQALLDRLALKVGDTIRLGEARVKITDVVVDEPDKFGARLGYGPRVLMSLDTLLATGLVRPGTIIDWRYDIAVTNGAQLDQAAIGKLRKKANAQFVEAGYVIKDRRNPSTRVKTTLERLRRFLTLVGLTALLLGGIGVANAVSTYVDRRRTVIATYRSLGATSRIIGATLLVQVMALAGAGVAIGLVVGVVLPPIVAFVAGDALPFKLQVGVDLTSLGIAATYGFLVALTFVLAPLSKALAVRPAALYRNQLGTVRLRFGWRWWLAELVVFCALVGFAILTTNMPRTTLGFVGGTAVIVGLFSVLGLGVMRLAQVAPHPRSTSLKLALTNLASPDGLTRSIIVSMGAGLSLLVGLALVDNGMVAELRQRLPDQSPDYYALDIPRDREADFRAAVTKYAKDAAIRLAPMLRGRIVRLNGKPVDAMEVPRNARWVLRGDRGLTYSETPPKGAEIVEGAWWAKNHTGEPLVSFGAELGRALGLKVGDTLTVNILGRNVTARIANLRKIDWENLQINFVMVFSPNTLAGAPHNLLATVRYDADPSQQVDRNVARSIGAALPMVTLINVKDAINTFAGLFAKVMLAIRIAGSITLIAGGLVLAGALAAAHSRRTLQAVILKAVGATRARILGAHAAEYAMATFVTGCLAVVVGAVGARIVTEFVIEVPFVFSASVVTMAIGLAAAFIFVLGGVRTWRILSARPVPYLRGLE